MTRKIWRDAQRHELKYWSTHEERWQTPESFEQRRRATLTIWRDILDICGEGKLCVLEIGTGGDGFVNFIPDSFCVGLEPLLFEMRRNGIGIFSPYARFVCGMGEHLPFRDNSFDVVFLYNVLDHTSDPTQGMNEVRRVLRPNGVLHLLVDTYSLAFKLYRRFYRRDPYHPHTFTPRQIRRRLLSRGMRIVRDFSDRVPTGRRHHVRVRVFCVLVK